MKAILRRIGPSLIAAAVSLFVAALALNLRQADLRVPFQYDSDALWNLIWVKGLAETGSYLHNDRLGAPFALDLRDFPVADGLHFAALAGLAHLTGDPVLALNLYFLLTFPLTAIIALVVLRHFQVPTGPAFVAALLYVFLPYHFLRGEYHLFLAAYYLVPLQVMMALWIWRADGAGRWGLSGRRTLAAAAIGLLAGTAGVYYAFFGCFFVLVAGLAASYRQRRFAPLFAAGFLIAVTGAAVLANTAPTWAYHLRHGGNPEVARRSVWEAHLLGLNLGQLLLPVSGHRIGWLGHWRDRFETGIGLLHNENSSATLGVVGAVGFLVLVGRLLARRKAERETLTDGLALLNVSAVLLALTGGGSALFAYCISPSIRGYNRISVFIAFLALAAVALLLSKLQRWAEAPRWRAAFAALLALVLVGGLLDEIVPRFAPRHAKLQQQYAADAAFVAQIEASQPPGGMIFQLPALAFPEVVAPHHLGNSYELFKGYLHSRSLRWSFGAMRGRPAAQWQAHVAGRPPAEMLDELIRAGFTGIWLERTGYADRGAALEAQFTKLLSAGPQVNADQRLSFFDLTAYAERLRREAMGRGSSIRGSNRQQD